VEFWNKKRQWKVLGYMVVIECLEFVLKFKLSNFMHVMNPQFPLSIFYQHSDFYPNYHNLPNLL
jgi:hypothetical protein